MQTSGQRIALYIYGHPLNSKGYLALMQQIQHYLDGTYNKQPNPTSVIYCDQHNVSYDVYLRALMLQISITNMVQDLNNYFEPPLQFESFTRENTQEVGDNLKKHLREVLLKYADKINPNIDFIIKKLETIQTAKKITIQDALDILKVFSNKNVSFMSLILNNYKPHDELNEDTIKSLLNFLPKFLLDSLPIDRKLIIGGLSILQNLSPRLVQRIANILRANNQAQHIDDLVSYVLVALRDREELLASKELYEYLKSKQIPYTSLFNNTNIQLSKEDHTTPIVPMISEEQISHELTAAINLLNNQSGVIIFSTDLCNVHLFSAYLNKIIETLNLKENGIHIKVMPSVLFAADNIVSYDGREESVADKFIKNVSPICNKIFSEKKLPKVQKHYFFTQATNNTSRLQFWFKKGIAWTEDRIVVFVDYDDLTEQFIKNVSEELKSKSLEHQKHKNDSDATKENKQIYKQKILIYMYGHLLNSKVYSALTQQIKSCQDRPVIFCDQIITNYDQYVKRLIPQILVYNLVQGLNKYFEYPLQLTFLDPTIINELEVNLKTHLEDLLSKHAQKINSDLMIERLKTINISKKITIGDFLVVFKAFSTDAAYRALSKFYASELQNELHEDNIQPLSEYLIYFYRENIDWRLILEGLFLLPHLSPEIMQSIVKILEASKNNQDQALYINDLVSYISSALQERQELLAFKDLYGYFEYKENLLIYLNRKKIPSTSLFTDINVQISETYSDKSIIIPKISEEQISNELMAAINLLNSQSGVIIFNTNLYNLHLFSAYLNKIIEMLNLKQNGIDIKVKPCILYSSDNKGIYGNTVDSFVCELDRYIENVSPICNKIFSGIKPVPKFYLLEQTSNNYYTLELQFWFEKRIAWMDDRKLLLIQYSSNLEQCVARGDRLVKVNGSNNQAILEFKIESLKDQKYKEVLGITTVVYNGIQNFNFIKNALKAYFSNSYLSFEIAFILEEPKCTVLFPKNVDPKVKVLVDRILRSNNAELNIGIG